MNVCPAGWHPPTFDDLNQLLLGSESLAGGHLKSIDPLLWGGINMGATNESGFNALPGGKRHHTGPFVNVNERSLFFGADVYAYPNGQNWHVPHISLSLAHTNAGPFLFAINVPSSGFEKGASIRCVKH